MIWLDRRCSGSGGGFGRGLDDRGSLGSFAGFALRLAVLALAAAGLAGFALGRGRGTAHAEFFDEEDFRKAEGAAGQFAGVVVGEELDALLADFGEVNVPGLFAKVLSSTLGS